MDHLLSHYEREVGLLTRNLAEFARRFPKIAARLGMTGGHVEDPHVDRMVQTFALLAARVDAKLEDDYPQFTEALLEIAYAHSNSYVQLVVLSAESGKELLRCAPRAGSQPLV